MNDQQVATLIAVLNRIADALERQLEPDEEKVSFPLAAYRSFDWSTIGASVLASDADGVSVIRTAAGKICKRRSNDRFGTEIWFSYAAGRAASGDTRYVKAVEFKDVAPPEPLGRKTEQALHKAATPEVKTGDVEWLQSLRVNATNAHEVRERLIGLAVTHGITIPTGTSIAGAAKIVREALVPNAVNE